MFSGVPKWFLAAQPSPGAAAVHNSGTKKVADACLVVPMVNPQTVTPHTEAFQAVVWHLIVSHPTLKENEMKWESEL